MKGKIQLGKQGRGKGEKGREERRQVLVQGRTGKRKGRQGLVAMKVKRQLGKQGRERREREEGRKSRCWCQGR